MYCIYNMNESNKALRYVAQCLYSTANTTNGAQQARTLYNVSETTCTESAGSLVVQYGMLASGIYREAGKKLHAA